MPLEIIYDPLLRTVRTQDTAAAVDPVTSANIDHRLVQYRGEKSHAVLDGHLASAVNPHSVNAAQVGINVNTLYLNGVVVTRDYTPLGFDYLIICDTSGGPITINLPAGVANRYYKIVNSEANGNDVTVNPNGNEQVYGGGAGVAATVADGEIIDIHYNPVKGWW